MCAVQVSEETGLDVEGLLDSNHFIEVYAEDKQHKLFIIPGIDPDTTVFAPKVKAVSGYGCTLACLPTRLPACSPPNNGPGVPPPFT